VWLLEITEEVKSADAPRINLVALGEHQREDYAIPAPGMMPAAISVVTHTRILLSGLNVINPADPVKRCQDTTLIDLLRRGCSEIMAGEA